MLRHWGSELVRSIGEPVVVGAIVTGKGVIIITMHDGSHSWGVEDRIDDNIVVVGFYDLVDVQVSCKC